MSKARNKSPVGGWQVDAAIAKLKELRNHTCTRTAMMAVLQAAKLAPPPVSDDDDCNVCGGMGCIYEPECEPAPTPVSDDVAVLVAILRKTDNQIKNMAADALLKLSEDNERTARERDEAREARNRWYVDYCQAERERDAQASRAKAHAATIAQIKETNQRQYDEGYAHATALHAATIARLCDAIDTARDMLPDEESPADDIFARCLNAAQQEARKGLPK